MTLPEVLITMVIMGTVMTTLVGATTVILRQQDNSSGRLNNSRSEQSVGIWLPSDLASAEDVVTNPGASPCGTQCPPGINVGGSNALMLSWTGSIAGDTEAIPTRTTVSYRYVQVGDEFQVIRVRCVSVNSAAPTCDQAVVLHDVPAPPPGQTWVPGTTSPVWVIVVRLALDPAAVDGGPEDTVPSDPTYFTKNGRRVTVTINGGGDIAGAGGGEDSITLSAGGTDRKPDLSTSNFSDPPSFGATRSRCGGNFAMLVDTSGSIGSTNMASVRSGITAFINSFAGTPIKLEIVRFSSTSSTLGAGAGWSRYYDMLVDTDVADLKAQVATLTSTGGTNWEDGMFRVFKNSNGTVQSILPDTLIFFTDGLPTRNRLDATSATSPAVVDNDDIGLPASDGQNFHQVSWNRAWRIARDYYADVDRFIGVFVGSDVSASSTWRQQGAGYHLVNFTRGYHNTWDRGYHWDNPQRGYHTGWEYATTGMTYQYASTGITYQYSGTGLTYEYAGSGITYQTAGSGMTYQYAGSGVTYQYATTGVTYQKKQGNNWNTTSVSTFLSSNSTPDESDNYRAVVSGTPGGWTTTTRSTYDKGNTAPGGTADAFQVVVSSPSNWQTTTKTLYDVSNLSPGTADGFQVIASSPGSWGTTTQALYDASNSGPDQTDGFRVTVGALGTWTAATKAYYDLNNSAAGSTDGYRVTATGGLGTWTTMTKAQYDISNSLADSTDGFRTVASSPGTWTSTTKAYYDLNNTAAGMADGYQVIASSPGGWTTTTQAYYNANNTLATEADGYRTTVLYSSPYTAWEASTEALYLTNNTTSDNTDGWTATQSYTSPYTQWVSTTAGTYGSNNTTADALDGWRQNNVYTSPFSSWEATTQALYTQYNTTSDSTDGWASSKSYTQPYDFHEAATATTRTNTAILAQIVSEGAVVPAIYDGTKYTNAAVADFYAVPLWSQFAAALNGMALAECGGTVTVQTKVGVAAAADPFTYQNSVDLKTATTSSQFRSGTFDFDLSGGGSRTVGITPLNVSGLSKYEPVGWSCTASGVNYPFTTTPIAGSPWSKITLTVSPNQAISCVQTVRLK